MKIALSTLALLMLAAITAFVHPAAAQDADRTFAHPAEDNQTKNLTLTPGTYAFRTDADPNGYHVVEWYNTYSGGTPFATAYFFYYDDINFTVTGSGWLRAEVYRSDILKNWYEWQAAYRWNIYVLPSKPTSPSPANGATSQSINVDVSWANGGGATSYDVYFGTDSTPDSGELIGNRTTTSYDPGTLAYSTTYYWRIDAKNAAGTTTGDVWSFTTQAPPPPNKATSPSPANGVTGRAITTDVSWSNGGGATSYDVYFGTDSTPDSGELVGNQTGTSYDPGSLAYSTTYYWRVDAKNAGGTTTGDVWSFTTVAEPAAPKPSNPNPASGSTSHPLDLSFSWQSGGGTTARYEVWLGTSAGSLTRVSTDQTSTSYTPSDRQTGTTYYWRVDAKNSAGSSTTGDVWSFTTCGNTSASAHRGNTTAQEYGDALYDNYDLMSLGYDYNHAGLMAGIDSSGVARTFESSWGDNSVDPNDDPPQGPQEGRLDEGFLVEGADYYGAYIPSTYPGTMPFDDRRAVVANGRLVVDDAGISYPRATLNAINYDSVWTSPLDPNELTDLRCDGLVEYAYERHGIRVWRNCLEADSEWNIAYYPAHHNNNPGNTRDPHSEMSPWAQRGAPPATGPTVAGSQYSGPPWPDTKMTKSSPITLPTCQIIVLATTTDYVDLQVRATDESGIYQITHTKPDGDGPQQYKLNPERHPTSDTWTTPTIRYLRLSGNTYYPVRVAPQDHGGNWGNTVGADVYFLPYKPTTPTPPNGSIDRPVTQTLSWVNGGGATSYDIYFGTDSTPDSTESVGNQTGTTYNPGTLVNGTTYYWRIDSKNSAGTTTGDVWSFTVITLPSVSLTATDATAGEPATSQGNGTFTFTRPGPTTSALTVNFTVGGTAGNGSDYTSIGTTVSFETGSATATKSVSVADDSSVESDETVVLTLALGSGYTVGSPSSATVTIKDDDATVSVSANDATAGEPTSGQGSGTFTFSRSGYTAGALTLNFGVSGTAASGSDYASLGTTVSFGAGALTATKLVSVIDDSAVEGTEDVILSLASGTGYNFGSPTSATITISDDDNGVSPPVVLSGMTVSNGVFRFTVTGPVGSNCVTQVSSNLVNWTPIFTNAIPGGGSMLISDPNIGNQSKRFFRMELK